VGAEGYVGVVLVPFFLTSDSPTTLDHFLAHVDHIAGLIGIDHVGIGSDWSPEFAPQIVRALNAEVGNLGFRTEHRVDFGAKIEGLDAWADWPNVTRALVAHGFSDDEIRGLVGGNFLRLFRDVVG
jgi:membrane dipeptidase